MTRSFFSFAGLLCALCVTSLAPATARAQRFETYVTFAANHLTNIPTGVVVANGTPTTNYGNFTPVGFGYGLTVNLLRGPKFSFGIDARGTRRPGIAGSMDDGLFGFRLAAHSQKLRLDPYVIGTAGFMSVREANTSDVGSGRQTTDNAFASHYAVVKGFIGMDYRVKSYFSIRVAELGFGSSFGTSPNTHLLGVNSGGVFRF